MGMKSLQLLDPSLTRQIQRLEAGHRMKMLFPAIIETLNRCSNWQDVNSAQKANELLRITATKDFALMLVSSEFFMAKLVSVANIFQNQEVDFKAAKQALDKVITELTEINREVTCKRLVDGANRITQNIQLYSGFMLNREYSTPWDYCNAKIIDPMIKNFIETVKVKFSTDEFEAINAFSNLTSMPMDVATELAIKYKEIVHPDCEESFFKSEFSRQLTEIREINFDPKDSLHEIAKKIHETHPYISRILIIGATVWVSTSSAERSFSKLKLIKSYIRSKMEQARLSNIALISINREWTIDIEEIIDEFAMYARKINFL